MIVIIIYLLFRYLSIRDNNKWVRNITPYKNEPKAQIIQ
jgi:hypothetical protein